VYTAQEVDQLKQRPNFPTTFLDNSMRELFGDSKASDPVDEFVFSTIETPQNAPETDMPENMVLMNTGEEIAIDDI
jgi:hypothetical protein